MLLTAIIAALCGGAFLIIAEITAWAFCVSVAKICGVVVVLALLILFIKFVLSLFDII